MMTIRAGTARIRALRQSGRQRSRRPAGRVRRWLDVWSERRALSRLDARALADLGLTPADVRQEAARSPFDLPYGRWESL